MTNNQVANGAQLDDCHSSIFSLADLTGLRWRTFSATLSVAASPSDDPILMTFSKCLAQDILAVWRKAPNPKKCSTLQTPIQQFPEDEVNGTLHTELKKELWIFWWGDEPSVEDLGRTNGLAVEPEGSWEEQGLSYEVRTLLFKAIHNLVERCLLSDNFVRIGRWFLRPVTKDMDMVKSAKLSCAFTFFLRGEMTVCTTVEIAQHQPVEAVKYHHIRHLSNTTLPVILSPYGLQGTMTGVAYKSPHDPTVRKVIEDWKHFYPLQSIEDEVDYNGMDYADCPVPPVVEVNVAGVRMNYPSSYVLLPTQEPDAYRSILDKSPESAERKDTGYHAGLPSVSSTIDGIKSVGSDTFSNAPRVEKQYNYFQCERPNGGVKKFSRLITNLLSRIVRRHQVPPDSLSNAVSADVAKGPEGQATNGLVAPQTGTWQWSGLKNPFRSARLHSNFIPCFDEENGQLTGKQKFNADSPFHVENKRKADKAKQTQNTPFHHRNASNPFTGIPSPRVENILNHHPLTGHTMAPNLTPQIPGVMGVPPFYPVQEEMPKLVPHDTANGMLYGPDHNVAPAQAVDMPQGDCQEMNIQGLQGQCMYPPFEEDIAQSSIVEKKDHTSLWKRLKLPPPRADVTRQEGMRQNVTLGNLDLECEASVNALRSLKRMKHNVADIQSESAWNIHPKRRKTGEEKYSAEEIDSQISKSAAIGDYAGDPMTQHVTVSARNGELAGMRVLSDPYEFEEDEKDGSFPLSFNTSSAQDISLKQIGGAWPNEQGGNPQMQVKQENHHLENLLKQENSASPAGFPDGFSPVVSTMPGEVNSVPRSSLLMDKKDLKVSAYDLEHMFDAEDDDVGILTPPDDHGREHVTVRRDAVDAGGQSDQILKCDLQRMFPTPSSQESCQSSSPDGKQVEPASKMNPTFPGRGTGSGVSSLGQAEDGSIGEREIRFSSLIHQNGDLSPQNGDQVYSRTPISEQPLPGMYLPVKLPNNFSLPLQQKLSQLPAYAPIWQMSMDYMNNPNMMMDVSEDGGMMQMNKSMHSQSELDITPPSHSHPPSVKTPASVPQSSPANFSSVPPRTPRSGNDSMMFSSPASSVATPATFGRTQHSSVSSSVAQSELGSCHASALYVNLMLSDSILNLFRDISFDQCPMCVCNDNISSRDVDFGYLPSMADNLTEGQYPCSCGFSAVRNRCLSVGAGLFLEDELEIVGKDLEGDIIRMWESRYRQSSETLENVVCYAVKQSANPYAREVDSGATTLTLQAHNVAAQLDIMEACLDAINGGISVMEIGNQPKIKLRNCKKVIHHWHSTRILKKTNSTDLYEILQYLKPVLQNAIQKLRSERSFNFIQRVTGPLTWREFCKDNSYALEPLPVPKLLVGQNYDWMAVSPFALDYWEKLWLEPYAGSTNVSYLVMCPDVTHVFNAAKTFFHELSYLYEHSRLGMHRPFIRHLKENGIIGISSDLLGQTEMPEWCKRVGGQTDADSKDKSLLDSIKQYALACNEFLHPFFDTNDARSQVKQPVLSSPQGRPNSNNPGGKPANARPPTPLPSKGKEVPQVLLQRKHIVGDSGMTILYFIDPFPSDCFSTFSIAVWNCYQDVIKSLPDYVRDTVVLQIVPLSDILQFGDTRNESDVRTIRSLAFNSYFQCRRSISQNVSVRTMTVFGPTAGKSEPSQGSNGKTSLPTLHSPAYVLANSKMLRKDMTLQGPEEVKCNILYVAYCLSHDQKWVLASATDQDGELLETFCVNIDVPPRRLALRRKQRVSVKDIAIQKLWKLCVSTVTQTATTHWRVVIGRLGRLGHGEIQEWGKHLNRKSLSVLSKQISSKCSQCTFNGCAKHPRIISACLTSLEPEGAFTILPDNVKVAPFGRNATSGTQLQLKTPEDASCTHIYVFPTSSFVQTAGETFQSGNLDILPDLDFAMPEFGEQDDLNIMEAVNVLFQPSSPAINHHQSVDDVGGHMKSSNAERLMSNEETSLLQQPLALGYLVSTAPTGPLPDSFWVSCPHATLQCPVFLRFGLHIQIGSDEVHSAANGETQNDHHQLDSAKTAHVLRYVMENYNALSWLTCDPVSRDRRSCLPIHYFVLTKLYRSIKALT